MELLTTNGWSGNNYGWWLNQIMASSPSEWVCIYDHDVYLANPRWYKIILGHIEKHPEAGLFTCMTNRVGNPDQKVPGIDRNNHDISYHVLVARKQEGLPIIEATRPISGLLMVTSKEAWRRAGGFRESGIIGVDNDYHRRIKEAGLKVYIMQDLYVYHAYRAFKI